jgi:hypothetical protein
MGHEEELGFFQEATLVWVRIIRRAFNRDIEQKGGTLSPHAYFV